MNDRLPENLVRTKDLPWDPATRPSEFGTSSKFWRKRLLLIDVGAHLERVDPGIASAPLHDHLFGEEHFYVLSGTLSAEERLPDGARRSFELRAGDFIAYPAGTRIAHRFVNRSSEPVEFLALSDRQPGDICTYPNSDKTLLFAARSVGAWLPRGSTTSASELVTLAQQRKQSEPIRALTSGERPPHVVPKDIGERDFELGPDRWGGADLTSAGGGKSVVVTRERLTPRSSAGPLHSHAFNEELVFVLAGRLTLRQRRAADERGVALEPGDFVHFPPYVGSAPADALSHQLRNDSDQEAVFLKLATQRPYDIVEFPETGERFVLGLDEVGRVEPLDYWHGES